MHGLRAVEIQYSENLWSRCGISFRRNSTQRHTCYGPQVHGENACLSGEISFYSFHHHDWFFGRDNFAHDTLARLEVHFSEPPPFRVETGGVTESVSLSRHDECALGPGNFQCGFENLLKAVLGREYLA